MPSENYTPDQKSECASQLSQVQAPDPLPERPQRDSRSEPGPVEFADFPPSSEPFLAGQASPIDGQVGRQHTRDPLCGRSQCPKGSGTGSRPGNSRCSEGVGG